MIGNRYTHEDDTNHITHMEKYNDSREESANESEKRRSGRSRGGCLPHIIRLLVLAVFLGCFAAFTPYGKILQETARDMWLEASEQEGVSGVVQKLTALPGMSNSGPEDISANDNTPEAGTAWAYQHLDETEQEVYRRIERAVSEHRKEVHFLEIKDTDQLFKITEFVYYDHPEYFWWELGSSVQTSSFGDVVVDASVILEYNMSEKQAEEYQKQIDSKEAEILAALASDAGDYAKTLTVYEYLIANNVYDENALYNQSMVSALVLGRTVCSGYSRAMQYLLNRMGIFCTFVTGTEKGGEGHSWNLVGPGGKYYYIDTTWGDPQFLQAADEESGNQAREDRDSEADSAFSNVEISYDYFCITSEELLRTHTFKWEEMYPTATAIDCNYYYANGYLMPMYERSLFKRIMEEQILAGKRVIEVKFQSEMEYERAFEDLITRRSVIQLMNETRAMAGKGESRSAASYVENRDLYILKFYAG